MPSLHCWRQMFCELVYCQQKFYFIRFFDNFCPTGGNTSHFWSTCGNTSQAQLARWSPEGGLALVRNRPWQLRITYDWQPHTSIWWGKVQVWDYQLYYSPGPPWNWVALGQVMTYQEAWAVLSTFLLNLVINSLQWRDLEAVREKQRGRGWQTSSTRSVSKTSHF